MPLLLVASCSFNAVRSTFQGDLRPKNGQDLRLSFKELAHSLPPYSIRSRSKFTPLYIHHPHTLNCFCLDLFQAKSFTRRGSQSLNCFRHVDFKNLQIALFSLLFFLITNATCVVTWEDHAISFFACMEGLMYRGQ